MDPRRLVRGELLDETVQTLQQLLQTLQSALEDLQQSLKRQESHTGTTNVAGLWAVTFVPPFDELPHVTVELVSPDEHTGFRVTTVTAAGFTVHVYRRTVTNILGLQVPNFMVQNVAGQACTAAAFQR